MSPLLRAVYNPNVHTAQESGAVLACLAFGSNVPCVSGKYFETLKEIKSRENSCGAGKQDKLWEWAVKYLAGRGGGESQVPGVQVTKG